MYKYKKKTYRAPFNDVTLTLAVDTVASYAIPCEQVEHTTAYASQWSHNFNRFFAFNNIFCDCNLKHLARVINSTSYDAESRRATEGQSRKETILVLVLCVSKRAHTWRWARTRERSRKMMMPKSFTAFWQISNKNTIKCSQHTYLFSFSFFLASSLHIHTYICIYKWFFLLVRVSFVSVDSFVWRERECLCFRSFCVTPMLRLFREP